MKGPFQTIFNFLWVFALTFALQAGGLTNHAYSQNRAYESINISLHTSVTLSQNEFTDIWSGNNNVQLNLRTPFRTGYLETGFRYIRFTRNKDLSQYSSFHSAFIYAGWGIFFDISQKISVGPALRFGTHMMKFDREKSYAASSGSWAYNFDTSENEFAYEVLAKARFKLDKSWALVSELIYNRTLTFYPIGLARASVGLVYSFSSPQWFKKVAK